MCLMKRRRTLALFWLFLLVTLAGVPGVRAATSPHGVPASAPSVTGASVSPAALPVTGGTLTVSATVTDPNGEAITSVSSNLYRDGFYYTTLYLTAGANGAYTAAFDFGSNTDATPHTYTATVTGSDDLGLSTTVTATGACTQANDNQGPSVTNAAVSPATLPVTGGQITVSATAADPNGRGLSSVDADFYRDGLYYTTVYLGNGGGGSAYTGTLNLGNNTDAIPHTYTATVMATNDLYLQTTVPATGQTVQANDPTPLSVTGASLSPATLPAAGGDLTVTATVTAPAGHSVSSVYATFYQNGGYYTSLSLAAGANGVYTGTLTIRSNTTTAPVTYTASVTATNDLNLQTTVAAAGSCVQANDATPLSVTDASFAPTSLPVTGGAITATATVTAPAGHSVSSVTATVYTGNSYYTTITLSNSGGGSLYTGTFNLGPNTDATPHTYTATVTATNDLGLQTTVPASGTCTQPNDNVPPAVTGAAISPATLPVSGGTLTVSATATDPNGRAITGVSATVYQNGNYYTSFPLTDDGTGTGTFTGTFNVGGNGGAAPATFTAQVTATNDVGLSATGPASGSCVQANDPVPPAVTNAALSPASLPASGGQILVSATVTDPNGEALTNVNATLYQDGVPISNTGLMDDGTGTGTFTGTFSLGPNTDPVTHTFTVQVTATNDAALSTTVVAAGQTTQAGSGTPPANAPSVTNAALSPASLPVTGGQITITATVTDPGGEPITNAYATLYRDGFYYTTVYLSASGGGGIGASSAGPALPPSVLYTGTGYLGPNTDSAPHTYTATVTATDAVPLSTTVPASGACTQPNDNMPPAVTGATLTPATLPVTGGQFTVTATVADPGGRSINNVYAIIYRDGFFYTTQYMSSTDGSLYTGTYSLGNNTDATPHVYTAAVVVSNDVGLTTTVTASGSCTQANDDSPLSVTGASLGPATLPAAGGNLTITATVTAPAGHSINYVYAEVYRNGGYSTLVYLAAGANGVYTGTYNPGSNTTPAPVIYTAVVNAANDLYLTTTVPASGSCTQANDPTPLSVTDASLGPATLPVAGGTLTVTATVTAPAGHSINSVTATVYTGNDYYTSFYLTAGAGGVYTGTINIGGNSGLVPRVFTATVTATNDLYLQTTVPASGSCTQGNDSAPPAITSATLSPATLPVSGGTLTVSATVTDPSGEAITSAYATLYRNGFGYTSVTLTAGAGGVYTGTINLGSNTTAAAYVFTATVTASNDAGLSTTITATGSCTQANDNTPPSIANATLSPAALPVSGGPITITATVTDPNGRTLNNVYATLYRDGFGYTYVGLTAGANGVYTGTYNVPNDTDATPHTFTATVTAVNDLNLSATVPASGSCTQGNDNLPPTITNAAITPATLPVSGGQIAVTATVTDPNGRTLTSVTAALFRDGVATNQGIGLTAGAGGVYTGAFTLGPNTDAAPHIYTVQVTATNDLNLSTTVTASGQTTQTNDNQGPSVTNAAIAPPTLSAAGGTITVTATVTDPNNRVITGVTAAITSAGGTVTIGLTAGAGGVYTGTYQVGADTGSAPITFTATVTATNDLGLSTTVPAAGQTVQSNDSTPPSVTNASISPPTLTALGGTITVTATVNDPGGRAITGVTAAISNGAGTVNITLSNGGSGSSYTGTYQAPANTGQAPITYTATVTATNDLGLSTTIPAAGQTVEGVAQPPQITGASITPANVPATGGTITVSATVTDVQGVQSVTAAILEDGKAYGQPLTLTNSGSVYTATFNPGANTDATAHVFTATITATNVVGLTASATASGSATLAAVPPNPVPTITSLSPSSVAAGTSGFVLTINGTGFIPASTVTFGALTGLAPASQTATQLTVPLPASALSPTGTVNVTVTNPAPGGGTSSPPTLFTVTAPAGVLPTLSVTGLSFPNPVAARQTVNISWTVLNTGPGDASTLWTDSVYLSPTPTLDTTNAQTMLLGQFAAPTALTAGSQYTQSPSIVLPGVPAGSYYIIIVADSGGVVSQTTRAGDTLAMPITFQKVQTLLLSPSMDALTLHVGVALPGQLTLANMGSTPLTGIKATVSGVPANVIVQVNAPDHLDPMAEQPVSVSVLADNASITQGTATITLTSADGQQATATLSLTVVPPQPNLVVTSDLLTNGALTTGMVLGQQTIVQATVTNTGDATATGLQVAIPSLPFLTLSSPAGLGDLPPGASASIVLTLMPDVNLPLAVYHGLIAVNGTNTSIPIDFDFTAIATGVGDLKITTSDEFTYFADDHPPLTGAGVFLTNALTGQPVTLPTNVTDSTGNLLLKALPAGPYQVLVTSPNHANFNSTVLVTAGTETDVAAFLSRQLVTYQFTVVPIGIQDQYSVTLQALFQTNVPAPVVTISPMQVDLTKLQYDQNGQAVVYFTVTNHGLIAATDASLNLPTRTDFVLTTPMPDLGTLAALTTVVVPVTITNTALAPAAVRAKLLAGVAVRPNDGGGACFTASLADCYFCGKKICQSASVNFQNGLCPGGGFIPVGGGGGPAGGFFPYGGGTPVSVTSLNICDPCDQMKLLAVTTCLIGYIPGVPCLGSIVIGGAGCAAAAQLDGPQISAGTVEGCILGGIGSLATCIGASAGVGAFINTISCIEGFRNIDCVSGGGTAGHASAQGVAKPALSSDPYVAQIETDAARAQALIQPFVEIFGDPKWFSGQAGDNTIFANFVGAFSADTTAPGGGAQPISAASAAALAAMPLPTQITPADVAALVSRWNLTLSNYAAGIFTASKVPAGGSTNFIDFTAYANALTAASQAIAADKAEGGDGTILNSLHVAEVQLQQSILAQAAQEGTCAQVKIELDQTVTLTRTAFKATLELDNSAQSTPLSNVQVSLKVHDINGNDQTSLFGLTAPTLTGFTGAVDGTGSLGTGAAGVAQYTITPTQAAAANGTTQYFVTGTISYQQNGTAITIPLYPTAITVQPDPFLQLHYFLQQTVYGPDPFDPFNVNTPPEPFSLGLLAVNIGKGTAHDFSITTSQPKIVDNEKGLLVNFEVIGTQLNSQSVSPSLMIDFGDLTPVGTSGSTSAAQFLLTASLAGQFVGYDATFQHTDDLGNNTSLIDSVDIHALEHVVRDLWPTDDGKPDFLAIDTPNVAGLPDTLWSSDNTTYPVASVTNATGDTPTGGPMTVGGPVSDVSLTTTLTLANPPSGFVYIRTDNPAQGSQQLLQVLRSDGTPLLIGPNVWTTDRNVHLTSGEIHERRLYIFDYNSTGKYTLIYGQAAPVNESIGGLKQLPDGTQVTVGQGSGTTTSGTGTGGASSGGSGSVGSGGGTTPISGPPASGPVIVTAVFPDAMYVESLDRSSGIRVVPSSAHQNDLVVVTGVIQTGANGERYIAATQTNTVGVGSVAPLGLTVKSLYGGDNLNSAGIGQHGVIGGAGLNPVGLLTATLGKVTTVEAGDFFLDDGFGLPAKVLLPSGASAPAAGTFVGVSDVISLENDPDGLHPLLRPRSAMDIQGDVSSMGGTFTAPALTLNAGRNVFSLPGLPAGPAPLSVLSGLGLSDITGNLNRYDAPTQAEVFYDPMLAPFNLLNGEGYRIQLNTSQAQAEANLGFAGYRTDFADRWVSLPKLGATRIGDPLDFAVDWGAVQVTDGTKTVFLNDAAHIEFPAWLNSEATYRDNLDQLDKTLGLPTDLVAPSNTPPDSTSLMPWLGYLVLTQRDDLALIVPVSLAPVLQGIIPSTTPAGGSAFTLTVTGQNFVSGATVDWNGSPRPTTSVSATQLTAQITAADIAAAGTAQVTVVNPNAQASAALAFTITPAPAPPTPNPVPTITAISPDSTPAGGTDFTLTVTGTGFVGGATVDWNGSPRLTRVFSSTQLTAQITAADIAAAGSVPVTVFNPAPGGGTSPAVPFLVTSGAAVEVTGQATVTGTGLLYNRVAHTFSGTITVTNTSASAIAGPVQVVLTGLPSGITLTNATGAEGGSPYLTVSAGALAPGASVTVPVTFLRASGMAGVSYTAHVYSGSF